MRKNRVRLARLPLFIFGVAAYPSLALIATNIREVSFTAVLRPLAFSLAGGLLLGLILWRTFRNLERGSIAAAVFMILFFSYGHVARLLTDKFDPAYNNIIEGILYLAVFGIGWFSLSRIARDQGGFSSWMVPLNSVVLVLLLFPLFQIISVSVTSPSSGNSNTPIVPTPVTNNPVNDPGNPGTQPSGDFPDVYLIVLDGYARNDTMQEVGYDNSSFLTSLEDMGFFVAQCSHSNYRATLLSMTSTLNRDYLWEAIPNSGRKDTNANPLYEALVHSTVREDFEQKGYTIVGLESGYQWDEWVDADHYITLKNDPSRSKIPETSISEFEYIFLRNTLAFPFFENSALAVRRFYSDYNLIMFQLEELPKVAAGIPGPKFVYAHIMVPHTPFIFLPDGSLNTDSRYYNLENGTPSNPAFWVPGYINSIEFINPRIKGILDEIIKNSARPPIIVLQGDHGFLIRERRYNNLMAFYFPNGGDQALYDTISPVNTFRLISNLYFGGNYELRKDLRIDADSGRPYAPGVVKPFPATCP